MAGNNILIKQLPFANEAEQALLGAIITKPESFDTIGGMLTADDFYLEDHRNIYKAITAMYMQSKTIDLVTLVNELTELSGKPESNVVQYLSLIADSVPSISNIKEYARIIKEKSILRKLIEACDEISAISYEESAPVRTILDSAEQKIFDIANGNDTKEFRHVSEVLQNVYHELQEISDNKGAIRGVKSGFSGLDKQLVQLGKGDFIIVGARPGMGKTSFAMNIATNVARNSGKSVAIFSLEMSGEQLVTRILSSEAMVDSYSLKTGQLSPEDWQNIADVSQLLAGCQIFIDDTAQITATEMKTKLRRIPNLGLVVIDYLGLMESSTHIDNRAQQVADISRNLKLMAKEFGVPVICCAQLNRDTEKRQGGSKRPSLSDLRDSGGIEQDADVVLFLYRDDYYKDIGGGQDADPNSPIAPNNANAVEVIIAKNRHGAVGTVKMGWTGKFTKFRTIEDAVQNG